MSVSAAVEHDHGGHEAGHHLPRPVKLVQFRTLVIMLLVSDLVFVAGLFFAYIYLRGLNINDMWLNHGQVHPVSAASTWAIAGIMVVSSAAIWSADRGSRAGKSGAATAGLLLALLLVVADLVVQVIQMKTAGFPPTAGAYASSYIALAGYHVFHLALLLFVGLGLAIRSARGVYKKVGEYNEIALGGLAWYWVTVIAVAVAVLPH